MYVLLHGPPLHFMEDSIMFYLIGVMVNIAFQVFKYFFNKRKK